jgi:uncharacterized protein YyaL (SSP411 family)
MRIASFRLVAGGVPDVLAESLLAESEFRVPPPPGAEAFAIVCRGRTCLPPITDVEALVEALEPHA